MEVTQQQLDLIKTIPFLLRQQSSASSIYARMYLNGSQTMSSGDTVKLDTVSFSNNITCSTSGYNLTIQVAGQYHVGGLITWTDAAAAKQGIVEITINGVEAATSFVQAGEVAQLSAFVSDLFNFKVGDVITLVGQFTFSNGALDSGSNLNYLFAYKI